MRLPGEGAPTREMNLQAINRGLIAADRDDLIITDPAEMLKIPGTDAFMITAVNFASKFRMLGATATDLLEQREMPRFTEIEEYADAVQSGDYPGMTLYNFAGIPAFTRMLIVDPDSTIRLTMDITHLPSGLTYAFLADELLTVYRQMAQMVDKTDVGVLNKDDNSVNTRHLIANPQV
jgi:hypothetical protein